MITDMTFGECLKYMLSALDISINRLSKAINVDSSLVNRWINGKRIPAYHTPYIESITEYIYRNIQNSFQSRHVEELYAAVCKSRGPAEDIKEKIIGILLEAQGYSIECKKIEQAKNRKTPGENGRVIRQAGGVNSSPSIAVDDGGKKRAAALSREDKIILGTENILAAIAGLLEAAACQAGGSSNTIYISYNGDADVPERLYNILARCGNILSKAMDCGWKVLFMVKLSSDPARTASFLKFALPLLKAGRFFPFYIKKYNNYAANGENVIIPGIGAISRLPSGRDPENSCAFFFKSSAAVDVLARCFNEWLSEYTKPLFKYFRAGEGPDFGCRLAEAEDNTGNRFLFKYGFSVLTLTDHLFEKLLKKNNLPENEFLAASELHKKRLNAFLTYMRGYEFKDIYSADSIKDLVMRRQFRYYSYAGAELMHMEARDIIEHLENIIRLLETYDNYNIAFISGGSNRIGEKHDFYCMVKERQTAMIEVSKKTSGGVPAVQLSIEEPTLVKASRDIFDEAWEEIAPVNKDKKEIIPWLRSQINMLENSQ